MDRSNDPYPNGRWNTLELVKGIYGPDECVNDIAEIKFDKAVPIKVLFLLLYSFFTTFIYFIFLS